MASLFNIMKITVDEKKLRARVLVNPGMTLFVLALIWIMWLTMR